jgi:uncharacterized protein
MMVWPMLRTIILLLLSNLFMTYAWYGHLKGSQNTPLLKVIVFSWGIAFLEYCFQVPANRYGAEVFSVAQLKILQEVISMSVFGVFAILYLKAPLSKNFLYASLCLVGAVYFIFREKLATTNL